MPLDRRQFMTALAVSGAAVATPAMPEVAPRDTEQFASVPVDFRFSQDLVHRIESESKSKLTIDEGTLEEIGSHIKPAAFPITPITPDDIVEIVYTSGTTGEPKGVTHRHRHICANLRPFQSEIEKYKKWAWLFQPVRIPLVGA